MKTAKPSAQLPQQRIVPTLRITNYSRKVPIQEPPNQTLQGLRDMTVIDPDGNKLRICTRLSDWKR